MPLTKISKTTKTRTVQKEMSLSPIPASSPEVVDKGVTLKSAHSSKPTAKKRSAPVTVDSDSDIQIIETPLAFKKTKRETKPAPGSPEFKTLPSVTSAKKVIGKLSKKLSFGSIGSNENVSDDKTAQLESPIEVTEKRVSRPSANVKYMSKGATVEDVASTDSDATPPPPAQIFTKPTELQKKFSPKAKESSPAVSLDEDSGINSSAPGEEDNFAMDSDGKEKDSGNEQGDSEAEGGNRSESPERDPGESEEVALATPVKVAKSTCLPKRFLISEPDDSDNDQQMAQSGDNKSVSDTTPKPSTKNKGKGPTKHEPCSLYSFTSLIKEAQFRGEFTDTESTLPLYAFVVKLLSGIGKQNFQQAFAFVSDGLIVNPAKSHAVDAGVSKESRVIAAGGRNSLLFVSSGCVTSCELFIPGTNSSGIHIKKIGIWVLNEEFNAITAYLGAVFGVSSFYCHYINDILTFQSQTEGGASKASASASGSPKKASALFGAQLGPAAGTSNSMAALSFPPFVKFTKRVSIYDISKKDFKFTAANFAKLASLPLYKNGLSDLPQNAAVTVGYTANTFSYNKSEGALVLSLNVQFVLFHGKVNAE